MRKVLVSIVWIVVLEIVFYAIYLWLLISFNSDITQEESYRNGMKYGVLILITPITIVILSAVSDKLPFANKRATNSNALRRTDSDL